MSRRRTRGFTLLEVLVAVALLGLVVTVLARSAIQGMAYEGDASRRLRASLIADHALSIVESNLKLGVPPQLGHQESVETDEFQLSVDVQPFDPVQAGLGALLAPPEGPLGAAAPPPPAAAEASAAPLPLFLILVRVGWVEGLRELAVTRTTFAYDATAALQALGAANPEAPPQDEEQNPEELAPEEETE